MKHIFSILLLTLSLFKITYTMEEQNSSEQAKRELAIDFIWALRRDGGYSYLKKFNDFTNTDKGKLYDKEQIGKTIQYAQKYTKEIIPHTAQYITHFQHHKKRIISEYQKNLYASKDQKFIVFVPTQKNNPNPHKIQLFVQYKKIRYSDYIYCSNIITNISIFQKNYSKTNNEYWILYTDKYNNQMEKKFYTWSDRIFPISDKKKKKNRTCTKKNTTYPISILPWTLSSEKSGYNIKATPQGIKPTIHNPLITIRPNRKNGVDIFKLVPLQGITGVAAALLYLYNKQNNTNGIIKTIENIKKIADEPEIKLLLTKIYQDRIQQCIIQDTTLLQAIKNTQQNVQKIINEAQQETQKNLELVTKNTIQSLFY